MSKNLFSIKSPLGIALTLFAVIAIFFVSRNISVFLIVISLTIVGKSESEIEVIFANNSYWPKVIAYIVVASLVVWLVFRALSAWRLIELRRSSEGKATENKNNKKKLFRSDLDFLMLRKFPTPRGVFEIFITYGLYVVAFVAVAGLLSGFGLINTDQTQELGVLQPDGSSAVLAVFFMFVVIPPIFEEILFRGLLYNKLTKYAGIGMAYVLTSVLFGVAHLEQGNLNWIAATDTLIFSGFLIYISQKHQSLYSSMLLHAMKNSVAFYFFVS